MTKRIFYVFAICLLSGFLIGSCDPYENPPFLITLNTPFVLKNSESQVFPKGNVDTANYVYKEKVKWRLILVNTVDLRCKECASPSDGIMVKLKLFRGSSGNDSTSFFLGNIPLERRPPDVPANLALYADIDDKRLWLRDIERISNNEVMNQSTTFKEVTLILTE